MPSKAPRHGKHYEDAEIALLYMVERSDKAKRLLAGLLGRTENAIDLVWRWVEGADFPAEAYNRIQRQIEWAEERLGARTSAGCRSLRSIRTLTLW